MSQLARIVPYVKTHPCGIIPVADSSHVSQRRISPEFSGSNVRYSSNECVSWLRRRQRTSQLQEQVKYAGRPVQTPDQECEEKELHAAVKKAMGSLSEKNRLAVTLYYIDGLSQREVAGFLGISTSAVESRISRARKQLREEMIKMVEDTFKDNALPDDFAKKVKESLDKAQEAKKKGIFGEALVHSDEVLDALANLPESREARRLRKEALWLKGDAVRFPLGGKEALKYHEQALELQEKQSDRRGYAWALLRLSGDYSDVGRRDKAAQCKRKALQIYEEVGDLAGQAEIWMWRGADDFFTESGKALTHFQKALKFYSQMREKDLGYESVCRAAVSLLKEVEASPGTDQLIECKAVSDVLERTPDRLDHIREPGFGRGHRRYEWEAAFAPCLFHSLQDGGRMLNYDLSIDDNWMMEAFSYTFKPLKAMRSIESSSESVSIAAGEFASCLKVKTVITPSPDDDGPERKRKLNRINCGTKQAWFAQGVGPVKFIFDRTDGVHVHMELAEYSIEDEGDDYFPLSVGNRWIYHWPGLDERYIAKDHYEVAVQKDNVYYIDHYAYAYFSGSKEEYDALGK
jgi:predicted DNA-binding protein YlxM (UPF0122 family)